MLGTSQSQNSIIMDNSIKFNINKEVISTISHVQTLMFERTLHAHPILNICNLYIV